MKDELLEMIEALQAQIEMRLPMDNPAHEALARLIPILELLRQRVNAAHMKAHDVDVRTSGMAKAY